jgi:hypothetical protein
MNIWSVLLNHLPMIALILAVLIALKAVSATGGTGRLSPLRVQSKPLMTQVESETLGHLEHLFPHVRIHAQVAMSAIIAPAKGLSSKQRLWMHRRFGQKVIDFVLQDRGTGNVIVLVELDDATHSRSKDRDRDLITRTAGYSTVRLSAKSRPTRASVEAAVAPALA